jgi:hypothetical protein
MSSELLDTDELCRRLAKACAALRLTAEVQSPTRVRVGATGAGMLAETIRCQPDDDEVLQWWWSWGEPFCPASAEHIDRAAEMIRHVVTPAHA